MVHALYSYSAKISKAPCSLNVRQMLISDGRINLQTAQQVGVPNDGMHHQEIMLLT